MENGVEEKEVIPNKYKGRGKKGLFCPFRQGNFCNENCGLFCIKLSSCVFHGINLNLQRLTEKLDEIKKINEK